MTPNVVKARPIDFSANFGHTGVPVTVSSVRPGARNCVWVWCHTRARCAPRSAKIASGMMKMCRTSSRFRMSGPGNSPPKNR